MAEFLIAPQSDPGIDRPNRLYAGAIVYVAEDGHQWGAAEAPPAFYIVKVPGIAAEDVREYMEAWRHVLSYSIVNSQPAIDGYRIKVESSAVSVSGKGAFTREQVEAFIESWGGTIQSVQSNSVTFDISIYSAATSPAFWDAPTGQIEFSETEYNQESGDHLIEVLSANVTPELVEQRCKLIDAAVYVAPKSFLVNRAAMRQEFQEGVRDKIQDILIGRRRWYISQAGLDLIAAAGGVLTVTPAQFVANVTDAYTT